MATNEIVKIERDGAVAVITLNRPEVRNAMNYELAAATVAAVEGCQDAGGIVITGAGQAFCAGLDLRNLGADKLGDLPGFVATVAASKVPIIAAVNGPAVTGGLELALACDFLIGSERATFADTHGRVGVYPGPVLYDLPHRVGAAFAREMSLTGNFIDAETALRVGLLNHVVSHAELMPRALGLADDIASQDAEMIRNIREGLAEITEGSRREGREAWRSIITRLNRRRASGADIAARREEVMARARSRRR